MQCPKCQHENPNEANFCMKCGTKLERKCSNCGADYPEEAAFCMKCGTQLVQETTPPTAEEKPVEPLVAAREAPEAERRQLTVMFCDLVGSTALSARLDPEELREVIQNYQSISAEVISHFEGHIAQYLGDGLLIYFGYPRAHEDDAQRAVRAGLGVIEAIAHLNTTLEQKLAVRIGVHTGLVVVGEIGGGERREQLALGETPNIAARLEGLAECRCSPYYQNSALHPFIQLFAQEILQFEPRDSAQEKLNKLEQLLPTDDVPLEEAVPLLAALLSIPLNEDYAPLNLAPEVQKQKTFHLLPNILLQRASEQPIALIFEDLHWADASTIELLGLIIEQAPTASLMMLLTFRPEFSPPWTNLAHLTQRTLARLSHEQITGMAESVTGSKILPDEVLEQIMQKTDGIPLFVEELTKSVLESGILVENESGYELIGPLPPLAIPATLHDSLMARLDRLDTVKEVAQLGATLGREFTYERLTAISSLDEFTLQRALGQLTEAELLFRRGFPPHATYIFKHALIQEAAYQSLLRSTRQQYHQRIALTLEEQFPQAAESEPELVAYHYTEAGLASEAVPYWHRAGKRAAEGSAYTEAIAHLNKGLSLISKVPDTQKQAKLELDLQMTLAPALMASKGLTAPEVEGAYSRARELAQNVGEPEPLFWATRGLGGLSALRKMAGADELAQQCLDLAQARQLVGLCAFIKEDLTPLLEHAEKVIALYDPNQHRTLASLYGNDPGVDAMFLSAVGLFYLGYPDQALKRIYEAIRLSDELSNRYMLVTALFFASKIHLMRREWQDVQEKAEAIIALSTEHGFPTWLNGAKGHLGWSLAMQGDSEKGIAFVQESLAVRRKMGIKIDQEWWLLGLAEAYWKNGQIEEGVSVIAEAMEIAEKAGTQMCLAELYRLKGESLLMQSDEAKAEACFHQAIEVTRRHQGKSLELRTTVRLCRLWQKRGKIKEARQMFQAIYGWFTEGFDTADLLEAKALLEELSTPES